MARRYARNKPHPCYSQRRLDLISQALLDLLRRPCPCEDAIAGSAQLPPPTDGVSDWHPWPRLLLELTAQLNETIGHSTGRKGEASSAAWMLIDQGIIEAHFDRMRSRRGRLRFVRLRQPGAAAAPRHPAQAEGGRPGKYAAYSRGRIALAARVLLAVLAEPADPLELLAASSRQPPPGPGWRPWPWVTARFLDRIEPITGSRRLLLPQMAAWMLAEQGRVQLATTPLRGQRCSCLRGRLRFIRLLAEAV